jgi:PilZ domain
MSDTMPQSSKPSDRRRFKRYYKDVPVAYELEDGRSWKPGKGKILTLDLSAGGARIRIAEDLAEGQYIRLVLHLGGKPRSTVGSIAWVESEQADGLVTAGVSFQELEDATRDQMLAYLEGGS